MSNYLIELWEVNIMQLQHLEQCLAKIKSLIHIRHRSYNCCCSVTQSCLFVTPWTATHQASLSFTISQSSLKFMSIESVMPSNHLIPFSSCPQSFSASGSFPMSWLFASDDQSIGASASVLPMNIQDWFPLALTSLISLAVQGTLESLLQHHSSKASILRCSAFSIVQLSHPYMTTGNM